MLLEILLTDIWLDLLQLQKLGQRGPLTQYRALVWKLLLRVIPKAKEGWLFVQKQREEQYSDIKRASCILLSLPINSSSSPKKIKSEQLPLYSSPTTYTLELHASTFSSSKATVTSHSSTPSASSSSSSSSSNPDSLSNTFVHPEEQAAAGEEQEGWIKQYQAAVLDSEQIEQITTNITMAYKVHSYIDSVMSIVRIFSRVISWIFLGGSNCSLGVF